MWVIAGPVKRIWLNNREKEEKQKYSEFTYHSARIYGFESYLLPITMQKALHFNRSVFGFTPFLLAHRLEVEQFRMQIIAYDAFLQIHSNVLTFTVHLKANSKKKKKMS